MRFMIACVLMISFAALGCNSAPVEDRSEVTGTVKLDGTPLAEGTISFDVGDGAVPGNGEIHDGQYKIAAKPGKNRVVIHSYKIDPKIKPSNDPVRPVDNRMDIIPDVYNSKTTLSADVGEKKTFDFTLSSKGK